MIQVSVLGQVTARLGQDWQEESVVLRLEEGVQHRVQDEVGSYLNSHFEIMGLSSVNTNIDEVRVGDGLPEDDLLVVHLSDGLTGRVVERFQQMISSIAGKQQAQVLGEEQERRIGLLSLPGRSLQSKARSIVRSRELLVGL